MRKIITALILLTAPGAEANDDAKYKALLELLQENPETHLALPDDSKEKQSSPPSLRTGAGPCDQRSTPIGENDQVKSDCRSLRLRSEQGLTPAT